METHSARALFAKNIQSAKECLDLYDGVLALKTSLEIEWLLRAAVVFVVSAMDAYFHDKLKYRIGKFDLKGLPPALAKFQIPIGDLANWEKARRKGNVLRNWVTDYYSTRPLQSPTAIADALKLCGIEGLWDTIANSKAEKKDLLKKINALVKRRNQIAHEGDRQKSRNSKKELNPIVRSEVQDAIDLIQDLVHKIENAFPV